MKKILKATWKSFKQAANWYCMQYSKLHRMPLV